MGPERARGRERLLLKHVERGAGKNALRKRGKNVSVDLHLATRGGAACLGRDDIGCLAAGTAGDLALFDSETLEMSGSERDLVAGLVLGATRPHTVLVHGRAVVRNGGLVDHDPRLLALEHARQSSRLLARAGLG